MKAIELLNKTYDYWPIEVDIKDGRLIKETDGFESKTLIRAWEFAEQATIGNEWLEISVWVFYKILHQKAKSDFEKGITILFPPQVPVDIFKVELLEELNSEGYEEMLAEFKKNN